MPSPDITINHPKYTKSRKTASHKILRNEVLHFLWNAHGPLVLVWHGPFDPGLEEIKKREPDSGSSPVIPHKSSVVGQGVIVEEEACRDVECDENVNGIVLVPG